MERVGFIGIGVMGKPMCLNLRKAGFPLTIYARRPEAAREVVDAGAVLSSSTTAGWDPGLCGLQWFTR